MSSYNLPPDFNPGDSAQIRALDNDAFHDQYMEAVERCAGGVDTILYDLIENRPEPDREALLSGIASPELTTTEDWGNYRTMQAELVRRAAAHLGLTQAQVFGE